jgi:Gpi18-like mannosyltransferase
VILAGYQSIVTARYQVQKPDFVLPWTDALTSEQLHQPYLKDPFLNAKVAWDSEFYLSIALHGYDDPLVRTVSPLPNAQPPYNRPLSLNYAFFPVYPYLMRLLSIPLGVLGLSKIATATLAGVLVSLLGSLAGMLALCDLSRTDLSRTDLARSSSNHTTGLKSAFYLISFPTSFFLAQVYTEGLFIGLSFGCLALLQRRQWIRAGILAAIATLTRAVGVGLLIPLLWAWFVDRASANASSEQSTRQAFLTPRYWLQTMALLSPLLVHLGWKASFQGGAFQIVQKSFFKCTMFNLSEALPAWSLAFLSLFGNNSAAAAYYIIEFPIILLGIISCLLTLKRHPAISVYGLLMLTVSTTCGTAWSISRYLLAIPSIFLVLSRFGQSALFDRIWSLVSILFLALLTTLFSFNLWAG